jgi:Ca2+-binding EF-hand superfamily protein
MKLRPPWWIPLLLLIVINVRAATSVALMDFSVTDNSYRSMQAAAEFTGVVQTRLGNVPDAEWVEREELDQARRETELSAMGLVGGASYIRLGKWVKADWMVTGQFSLDDQNRRSLFIEITDLQHADVLTSRTLVLPGKGTSPVPPGVEQADFVAKELRELLAEAHLRQLQMSNRILVAPLFLADVTRVAPGFGSSDNIGTLEPNFYRALEKAAAANSQVQLTSFPKAYRSLDESQLVLNGLVEADRNAWQQTADIYVWGTYAVRSVRTDKPGFQLEMDLDVWDGISPPTVLQEQIPSSFFGDVSSVDLNAALNRLANEVLARAHKRSVQADADALRQKIADTLVDTYNQMTLQPLHTRQNPNPGDPEKFMQAIHILETACFFDPDNANANVLYVTCRWGFWMEFNSMVKNEFWSKWRRSRAWGDYVKRFGLKPVTVDLPFPYAQEGGIPDGYLRAMEDVSKMFPQWDSTNEMALEDQWQREGVHTSLTEAEYHGFPKAMPHQLIWDWKNEVEAERWQRLTNVVGFISETQGSPAEIAPMLLSSVVRAILDLEESPVMRLAQLEKIWPVCVRVSQQPGKRWIIAQVEVSAITNLCREAGQPEKAGQLLATLSFNQPAAGTRQGTNPAVIPVAPQASSGLVPVPSWIMESQPTYFMFRLFPPNALPLEIHPSMRSIQFPKQFDVQAVKKMDFLSDKLLILAMDERSTPSSDSRADVSAERLEKRGRLWVLPGDSSNPVLYEPELLPETVRSFLLENHHLWIAGKETGYLDLYTQKLRRFDLNDGFSLKKPDTLAMAGNRIFVGGDFFKVCTWDSHSGRWDELPNASFDRIANSLFPSLLVGKQPWLVSSLGSVLAYNVEMSAWTNLTMVTSLRSAVAEDAGFWFGTDQGLQFYDPGRNSVKSWPAASFILGMNPAMLGAVNSGHTIIPRQELDRLDNQIQDAVEQLASDHRKVHRLKVKQKNPVDPLQLNWRIPGGVMAMANDGDFLWLGVGNYFGNYLLLLHKPSESLVAYCPLEARGRISSLAVSATSVWVGMAYGDQLLVNIPREAFLSVPKTIWTSLAISPEDRERLIRGMSIHDRAMYAFYAGDDATTATLLGNTDPDRASLEEMFLLAFTYDVSGLDKPDLCRSWFERIISRYPDSPWAKAAQTALSENERDHNLKSHDESLLAKYDRNHNGVLDPEENIAMQKDPSYQREETTWQTERLDTQLEKIMQQFDQNGDGKLDLRELEHLRSQVQLYSTAPPEILTNHDILVAPLLTRHFPPVSVMLRKYDANHDGGLEANELKIFAQEIEKNR